MTIVDDIIANKSKKYYNLLSGNLFSGSPLKTFIKNEKFKIATKPEDVEFLKLILLILIDPESTKIFTEIPGCKGFYNLNTKKMLLRPTAFFKDKICADNKETLETYLKIVSRKKSFSIIKPKDDSIKKKVTFEKRKPLPKSLRDFVWMTYTDKTTAPCFCCGQTINMANWHCGHILAASQGGKDTADNLRPLCMSCNTSMSDKHMKDFIIENGYNGPGKKIL